MSAAETAAENSADMTDGFHLVVDALKLNGVDTIFGVAGIPITDLLRLAQNEGIRYLGFRHQQSRLLRADSVEKLRIARVRGC
jgi:oxalyl-CoA decarboxylase